MPQTARGHYRPRTSELPRPHCGRAGGCVPPPHSDRSLPAAPADQHASTLRYDVVERSSMASDGRPGRNGRNGSGGSNGHSPNGSSRGPSNAYGGRGGLNVSLAKASEEGRTLSTLWQVFRAAPRGLARVLTLVWETSRRLTLSMA